VPVRFETVVRAATANIALKMVALFCAVFLWLYVTAQLGEKQSFNVPLELVGTPETLAVVHEVPSSISITMRGPRSELLKLRLFGKVRATVALGDAHRGSVIVPLTTGILSLPEGFKREDVTIDHPKSLALDFEPVVSRYVPVRVAFSGELPKDMILVGRPAIAPERVLVRGAASVMDSVTAVWTEAIDLRNKRGRVSSKVALERSIAGREVFPGDVRVTLEVSKRAVRAIEGVPPTLLQAEAGMRVECSPKTATLTVEGPEELVNRLVPDDVSIILTLIEGKTGTYRIQPEVLVPQGIDTYSLDVESFEVKVSSKR
jgi:YbbR domain-containing protein